MAKRKSVRRPKGPQPLGVCRGSLGLALFMLMLYGFGMVVSIALNWGAQATAWLVLLWSLTQLAMGFAVFCLYRHQRLTRWAAVAVLLVASSLLTTYPNVGTSLLRTAVEALGVVGFSLVLYDVGKILRQPMGTASGLIFLAVIGTLLQTPLTAFAGLVLLVLGAYLAARQLGLLGLRP